MKRVVILLVLVLAAGAVYFYINSGALIKGLVEDLGSDATGVAVTVEAVELDLASGEATLKGLRVGNPEGFSDRAALSVDEITVGIDANTLRGDVITITRIYVVEPALNYESVDGTSNFDVIKQNSSSGESGEETEDGKKFIVNLVEFTGGDINAYGLSPTGEALNARMPGFKIRNVGKREGGVSAGVIASRIAVAVTTRVIEAVVTGALFDVMGDTVGGITDILPGFGKKDD